MIGFSKNMVMKKKTSWKMSDKQQFKPILTLSNFSEICRSQLLNWCKNLKSFQKMLLDIWNNQHLREDKIRNKFQEWCHQMSELCQVVIQWNYSKCNRCNKCNKCSKIWIYQNDFDLKHLFIFLIHYFLYWFDFVFFRQINKFL